jgi:hypothetical protein
MKLPKMKRGERWLLHLVNRKTGFKNFTLTVSADADTWHVTVQDHDTGAVLGGQESATFEDASRLYSPDPEAPKRAPPERPSRSPRSGRAPLD